jgi:Na+/proline symporter
MQKKYLYFIFLAFFLTVASFGIAFFLYGSLPPEIPMWYSLPWGETQLSKKTFIFLIPTTSLLFCLINLIFPKVMKIKDTEEKQPQIKFLESSFAFSAFGLSVINLITLIKIVGLFL